MSAARPRIAVIGSGIIGSVLAWRLAQGGAAVTVIDESIRANRATRGSFAWINAYHPDKPEYFALRLESMRLWREAAEHLPGLPVRFGGALSWEEPAETIEETARILNDSGNPARLVEKPEIGKMEPALAAAPEVAIEAPREGLADPDRIAEAFLAAALTEGAQLYRERTVTGFETAGARITGLETSEGRIEADHVVIAAGKATPGLLASLGIALPMKTPAGLLIRTQSVPPVSARVLNARDLHVWQMNDGSLILGEDFAGTPVGENRKETERRVLGHLKGFFTGVDGLRVAASTVTPRPTPGDGYPVIGRVPGHDGLWVATMHSGVTLAPVVAAHLGRELLGETEVDALSPFRIDRFHG